MKILHFDVSQDPAWECDLRDTLKSRIDPENSFDAAYWGKFIELADLLYHWDSNHEIIAYLMPPELCLSGNGVTFKVRVDSFDYAPLVKGLPAYHYRLAFRGEQNRIHRETRRETAMETAMVIVSELDEGQKR